MKQKYEKPMVIDLNVTRAWGGNIGPLGLCRNGDGVGTGDHCAGGTLPTTPACIEGSGGDPLGNACYAGPIVNQGLCFTGADGA